MENTHHNFIRAYWAEAEGVIESVLGDQSGQIDSIITLLFDAWQKDVPVYVMGNGGSASSASHFAADLSKTIHDAPGKRGIRALTPWDNIPLVSAIVNDRPKEDIFSAWLDTHYEQGGMGVGVSVHGGSGTDVGGKWSQNLLKGLQYIKDRGGKTIGFSGYDGGPMKNLVDVCVVVPVQTPAIGTAMVESFHVMIQHLIAFRLKEVIGNHAAEK